MNLRVIIPILFLIGITACEVMDDAPELTNQNTLFVSTDSILFDTLIAGRLSVTRRFRIYNFTEKSQTIEDLTLRKGSESPFRLIVNGQTSNSHQNTSINSGDSLLVLVDLLPPNETSSHLSLIDDEIIIRSTAGNGSVVLRAWSLAAEYLSKGYICDTFWGSDEVHVVTDTLVVDQSCTLTIGPGTKVLFDQAAALFVLGKLEVLGSIEDPVVFRYSRLDEHYHMAPGQWDGLYFLEGSTGNVFENAIIENGRIGLRLGMPDNDTLPDITLRNVTIRHMSQQGILAFSSDLFAENVLIYDVGQQAGFHAIGGSYTYNHVTFTNYPSQVGGEDPVMIFADHLLVENGSLYEPLHVSLTNSILWGGAVESDLLISLEQPDASSLFVSDNLIFSEQSLAGNLVSDDLSFPAFLDPFLFDYQLDSLSPAIDKAIRSSVRKDITGADRVGIPDLGAFEFKPVQND